MRHLNIYCWVFLAFVGISPFCNADDYIVEHVDNMSVDEQLGLAELIDLTLAKYPESGLLPALEQEAEALQRRGDSWTAGALNAVFFYRDSWISGAADTGAPEIEGAIEVPLWNWGQRSAGQQLAKQAKQVSKQQSQMLKLQVAGRVRNTLWNMALENNRYAMAQRVYQVSEKLLKTVKRRVELGDLPRADLLLAQSDQLSKRAELVRAEAELMHARKRYSTLTQLSRIPADFNETQSQVSEINLQHPALSALNAVIERKKAELNWVKAAGSGQTTVALGANSQRGAKPGVSVETLVLEINMPFGGGAHQAPEIAAVNVQLSEAVKQRDHLYRQLTEALHEASHALEVDQAELKIAEQRREIADAHLKMIRLSFNAGAINLLDLLKIQTRAQAAIRAAQERKIILQRDIVLYNQVVGQLP